MSVSADNVTDGGAREFRFLDIEDILFTHTVGIFGRRGSGKTTVTMNILQHKVRVPRGLVMCPTPEAIVVYSDSIPMCFIYDYFDEGVITRIMDFQYSWKIRLHHQWKKEVGDLEAKAKIDRVSSWMERMKVLDQRRIDENLSQKAVTILYEKEMFGEKIEHEQNTEMRKSYARTLRLQLQEPHSMFFIMDDLSSDKDAIRSATVKKLMDNGRHYLMLLIIACQYSMDFPAACRGGLDWVIIFFDTLMPNVKRLYDNYVGEFPNKFIFSEAFAEAARRRCCLVINKRSRSPNVYDSVFLFAPQELWLSDKYFGDPLYKWMNDMFFSEEKFYASQGGNTQADTSENGEQKQLQKTKEKKKKVVKPPSKSFSIESIELSKPSKKKNNTTKATSKNNKNGDQQQHQQDGHNDDDDDDYDPELERKTQEKLILKQNVEKTQQKLKSLAKQAQQQFKQRD